MLVATGQDGRVSFDGLTIRIERARGWKHTAENKLTTLPLGELDDVEWTAATPLAPGWIRFVCATPGAAGRDVPRPTDPYSVSFRQWQDGSFVLLRKELQRTLAAQRQSQRNNEVVTRRGS